MRRPYFLVCLAALGVSASPAALAHRAAPGTAHVIKDGRVEYREAPPLDYHLDGYRDEAVMDHDEPYEYAGRWTGTWHGTDGRSYSGEYDGRFEGNARAGDARNYHDFHRHYRVPPGGRIEGGFYYPPPIVTTTVIEYRRTGE